MPIASYVITHTKKRYCFPNLRKELVRVNQEKSSKADACQVMRDQKWPPQAWRERGKKSDSNGKNRAEEEWNAWLIHSECSKVPEVHYNITIIITFLQISFLSRGFWKTPKTCAMTQFPFHSRRRRSADEQHLHRWNIHTLLFLLVNFKCKSMIFCKNCNIEEKVVVMWCIW